MGRIVAVGILYMDNGLAGIALEYLLYLAETERYVYIIWIERIRIPGLRIHWIDACKYGMGIRERQDRLQCEYERNDQRQAPTIHGL